MPYLRSNLGGRRRYILELSGLRIEAIKIAAGTAAIDNLCVYRIGKNVTTFSRADRVPIAIGDLSVVAATYYCRSAAVLLRAIYPVRKLIVHCNMVKLCRRLVVPAAPGFPAIHGDDRALINSGNHSSWIFRIDPEGVVVVAARRASDCFEVFPAVGGAIK